MKILIIGASGLLGSAFSAAAKRRKHETIGFVGNYSEKVPHLDEQIKIDLRDEAETERVILELFPDAIVNCAAMSQPWQCVENPEESYYLNTLLPEKLARLARHLFATFIHISSEQVFDGKNAPYQISDSVSPINKYAEQKAESEKRVHHACEEFATTLRIPLLNGNSLSGNRSLHEILMANWAQGKATPLFEDEIRQPCLADNLAQVMVELCERQDLKGIYHWAGARPISRYEMGEQLIKHFGLPEDFIVKSQRGDDPRFANRQANLALDLQPLDGKLKTNPQTFVEQLDSLIVPKPVRAWYNAL
ncbi:SDR family oxidoreductase [Puniceicoccaceae bacterium K14]|nr:SDR family oxidoreductase [Puniceicoccaceae bacterium K14]